MVVHWYSMNIPECPIKAPLYTYFKYRTTKSFNLLLPVGHQNMVSYQSNCGFISEHMIGQPLAISTIPIITDQPTNHEWYQPLLTNHFKITHHLSINPIWRARLSQVLASWRPLGDPRSVALRPAERPAARRAPRVRRPHSARLRGAAGCSATGAAGGEASGEPEAWRWLEDWHFSVSINRGTPIA